MSDVLFGRKIGLLVYNPAAPNAPGSALDLSEFRIRFNVFQSDYETPGYTIIRVYNLADKTKAQVKGEFQRVTLEAGYDFPNGTGVIFDGTIKQVLFGHESNVDSYMEILASDGDLAYNNACVNTSLAPGATLADQLAAIQKTMTPFGVTPGYTPDLPNTALARGKVLYGNAKSSMRDLANTAGVSWSIQNGELTLIPLTGYIPGQAVVLNSATGLIGFPEQTPGGINVTALLNPKIKIGTLVQIAAEDINQDFVFTSGPALLPGAARLEDRATGFIAKISGAGFYKVFVSEFEGDTRGEPWYSKLVCLAIDISTQNLNPYFAGAY